ncbi:MAG TPA: acyl-CoA dehydrogenase family protein, partial [Gemmataceae bacterium]|nr:acyl-CoA dehydrogenase family protein [Gemmataceae bacterium]
LAREGDAPAGSARRLPFVFFAIRPGEAPAYQNVRKTRTLGIRPAFVGEFEVKDHHFPQGDVISQGRQAWDAAVDTVNFGKFFLGFGSVGICEHAFGEALAHVRHRVLYGKSVLEMPHIRRAITLAFARLTAMKFFAYRALDYWQAASAGERRYLLWAAVQKAKVSTEGVKVMALLSECVGARGFEAQTYFESALRDVPLIPALEGSTHINFALTARFIDAYLAGTAGVPAVESLLPHQGDPGENPCWLRGPDRNPKTVRFGHFLEAFRPLRSVPNVRRFVKQVKAFRQFAADGMPAMNPSGDAGLVIAIGRCFSTIAYAQLVAENCQAANVENSTVSVLFHPLIEDLTEESLRLAGLYPTGSPQRAVLRNTGRIPATSNSELDALAGLIAARWTA